MQNVCVSAIGSWGEKSPQFLAGVKRLSDNGVLFVKSKINTFDACLSADFAGFPQEPDLFIRHYERFDQTRVRHCLLKPADYYLKKYGTSFYGLNKMHILMEKQHNRGQDGAGVANIKLHPEPGCVYINRVRSNGAAPIKDIFQQIDVRINEAVAKNPQVLQDPLLLKKQV